MRMQMRNFWWLSVQALQGVRPEVERALGSAGPLEGDVLTAGSAL